MKKYQVFIILTILALVVTGSIGYYYTHRTGGQITSRVTSGQHQKEVRTDSRLVPNLSFQTPTIEQIFSNSHDWTATLSAQHKRVMIATGDIIPARTVNYQEDLRHDYTWPYQQTAKTIKDYNADITFINLETPLISNCQATTQGMVFCGASDNVKGLLTIGVNVASLANNHAGNYGADGVKATAGLLNKNGIAVTGINGPTYKDIRGMKFAFLGYDDITKPQPGVANADDDKIRQEIKEARQNADVVIVTFHWGVEYRDQPDERQKYLGRLAVDSGADLVIGNHPHWIQPVEIYKGKLITYAHGNFVFDQMWSIKTTQGVIGKYTFYDNKLVDIQYFPIQIKDYGQPYFLTGAVKQNVLDEMQSESIRLFLASS